MFDLSNPKIFFYVFLFNFFSSFLKYFRAMLAIIVLIFKGSLAAQVTQSVVHTLSHTHTQRVKLPPA